MRSIFIVAALLVGPWASALELKGKTDFQTLVDLKSRSIEAKILYVGEHWAYLQRGFKKPARIERTKLSEASNGLLDQWATAHMDALTAEELKVVVDAAKAASKGGPLFVDPAPAASHWKITALNPDFRTTGLSGTCVLNMVQKDAWKWEENEEHSRTSSRPRWRLRPSRA
ncbi:hypothetical protein [Pontiella desulfatans]|nr:hypothetical protein [Pontiella desulfatans]